MKKLICSNFVTIPIVIIVALGFAKSAMAADKKDARVTQTIRDVRLLTSKAGARPAVVNDAVHEGSAVRTGTESRAELTFSDQTLTRLGSNTVFSYGEGGKDLDLASGAFLLCVPKNGGTKTINTAAATAAVTGAVTMTESSSKSWTKFIVVEGQACVKLTKGAAGQPCMMLYAGDMLLLPPGARSFTEKKHVNLQKLTATAGLVKGFPKQLPGWAYGLIVSSVDVQHNAPTPSGGYVDPTNLSAISQKAAANPPPGTSSSPPPVIHPPGPL